jgi:hypothetical protein
MQVEVLGVRSYRPGIMDADIRLLCASALPKALCPAPDGLR